MKALKLVGLVLIGLVMMKVLFFGLGLLGLVFWAIKIALFAGIIYLIAKTLGFGKGSSDNQ